MNLNSNNNLPSNQSEAQKLVVIAAIISNALAEQLNPYEQNLIGNLLEAVGQNLLVIQAYTSPNPGTNSNSTNNSSISNITSTTNNQAKNCPEENN